MGDTFQNAQWVMPETAKSSEPDIDYEFPYTYIPTVKVNVQIMHSKRLRITNNKIKLL